MKNILFVTTISGFLSQFEMNDVRLLQQRGLRVHYASNFHNPIYEYDKEELVNNKIILHHVDIAKSPTKIIDNFRAVRQIVKIIRENNIDIIHCHNPMGGVAARLAAVISPSKPYVIYTAHGFHFYKGASFAKWLTFCTAERLLAHCTDKIITINREDYNNACRFHLKRGGKTYQINGVGVNPHRFYPRPEMSEGKREELGIPLDAFNIVTAAELNDNKNQQIIIKAIAEADDEAIHYTVCGRGPSEKYLEDLAGQLGIGDRVHILGYRTDMEEVLQTADCFAFPSYREGLGVAAIEALLTGIPLIVADNRGTREYAKDGVNSIVCHADNTAEFTEAIGRLKHDKRLKENLASACRESAMKFTIQEVGKTMATVYDDMLAAMRG